MNELRKHLNEVRLMSASIAKKSSASAKQNIALHYATEPLRRRVQFSHYKCVIQVTVHRVEAEKSSSIAEVPDQADCLSKDRLPPPSNKISLTSASEPGPEDGLELAQLDKYSGKEDKNSVK